MDKKELHRKVEHEKYVEECHKIKKELKPITSSGT